MHHAKADSPELHERPINKGETSVPCCPVSARLACVVGVVWQFPSSVYGRFRSQLFCVRSNIYLKFIQERMRQARRVMELPVERRAA
jgi:hypothetical protein